MGAKKYGKTCDNPYCADYLAISKHFVTKIISSNTTTIVILKDGRKGVVKCREDDEYDYEKGALYAYIKANRINKFKQLSDFLNGASEFARGGIT